MTTLLLPHAVLIGWSNREVILPAGSTLIKATNLPSDSRIKWWVDTLPDSFKMDDEIESWMRNYGIGIGDDASVATEL